MVTKLIFVQIFFLALFEEKLNKLLDQLKISCIFGRISGIWSYRISGRAIWYPAAYTGYKKGRIIRPEIRCIPKNYKDKVVVPVLIRSVGDPDSAFFV
jgi:hypothetical protein